MTQGKYYPPLLVSECVLVGMKLDIKMVEHDAYRKDITVGVVLIDK